MILVEKFAKKTGLLKTAELSWQSSNFFSMATGFLPSLLYEAYWDMAAYVGIYLTCGNDREAIKVTKYVARALIEITLELY